MTHRILISLVLVVILGVAGCGGGGSSPGSAADPNIHPNNGQLFLSLHASHIVANIGGAVTITAIARDINGNAVVNIPVTFSIKNGTGVLSHSTGVTNYAGLVEARLSSPVSGFVSVAGQLPTPGGTQEATAVVFFALQINNTPTLTMDADGDNDTVFNESDDFTILPDGYDTLTIKARLVDIAGLPMPQRTVQFFVDNSYINFINGRYALTDENGEALKVITVSSAVLDEKIPGATIYAANDATGAIGAVTVYFDPIKIKQVLVSVNPAAIEVMGESTITVSALSDAGHLMPDGTVVTLKSSAGSVDPVAVLVGGVGTATFSAPSAPAMVTITATVGGVKGSATIDVIAAPENQPQTADLNSLSARRTHE